MMDIIDVYNDLDMRCAQCLNQVAISIHYLLATLASQLRYKATVSNILDGEEQKAFSVLLDLNKK